MLLPLADDDDVDNAVDEPVVVSSNPNDDGDDGGFPILDVGGVLSKRCNERNHCLGLLVAAVVAIVGECSSELNQKAL